MEFCRAAVRTKDLIHIFLLHELAYYVIIESIVYEHRYHGNKFLKVLEKLYHWDKHADVYPPAQQAHLLMPFVNSCQDDYGGKK